MLVFNAVSKFWTSLISHFPLDKRSRHTIALENEEQ